MKICLFSFAVALVFVASAAFEKAEKPPKTKLSDWGFFVGDLKKMQPAERVFAYEVAAPLFSDHAEKARFVFLPEGKKMAWNPDSAFALPVGAALIKTFFYSKNDGSGDRKLIETRLLVHEEKGWRALAYVWDAAQNDAVLEVAGVAIEAERTDEKGRRVRQKHFVPNLNECKGCHSNFGKMDPLGLTSRQLNFSTQLVQNQLVSFAERGILEGFEKEKAAAAMPHFSDEKAPLEARAKSWLDANCGHCHRAGGPANTSGLMLDWAEKNLEKMGLGKPPVAAGRATGGLRFSIVKGRPDESILVHRIESLDPGVMMPELGRSQRDEAGIRLVREWIEKMK